MKKTLYWMAGGFGLAVACGLSGLAHLSATMFTLTVFCTVPALIMLWLDALTAQKEWFE